MTSFINISPVIPKALAKLKKAVENGVSVKGGLDILQDLQDTIMLYRNINDQFELKYQFRSKEYYDNKNSNKFSNYKYSKNETVYLFIGNDNTMDRKWMSRWLEMIFIRYIDDYDCILESKIDGKNYQYCLALIRPRLEDTDWLSELDYEKFKNDKLKKKKSKKAVSFDDSKSNNLSKNSSKIENSNLNIHINDHNMNNSVSKPVINQFNMP